MKLFTQKGTVHKIIIAIVIVLLFNFISPTISSASAAGTAGGILFEPIKDLTLVIADSIISVTQDVLFGMDTSFLTLTHEGSNFWTGLAKWTGRILGAGIGGLVVLGGVGLAPFTGGFSLGMVAAGATVAAGGFATGVVGGVVASWGASKLLPERLKLPMIVLSPEEIFQNKIALLDVNFFNVDESKYQNLTTQDGQEIEQTYSALTLQPIISSWYYALRNLAIVMLLSILVYTGIRIIISSSADDKAKYKQRLMDWLVAMCLLFFMHYIMAFAVSITEEITSAVQSMNKEYWILIR